MLGFGWLEKLLSPRKFLGADSAPFIADLPPFGEVLYSGHEFKLPYKIIGENNFLVWTPGATYTTDSLIEQVIEVAQACTMPVISHDHGRFFIADANSKISEVQMAIEQANRAVEKAAATYIRTLEFSAFIHEEKDRVVIAAADTATFPSITREDITNFFNSKPLLDVISAPTGRFILPIPKLDDGLGEIITPNAKVLQAVMEGTRGHASVLELEASPQYVPADGTNVIIINRVDKFQTEALKMKLQELRDANSGIVDRKVIYEFLNYARGYEYDVTSGKASLCANAGFHPDIYNNTAAKVADLYHPFGKAEENLVNNGSMRPGLAQKKPTPARLYFMENNFQFQISPEAGNTMQTFKNGAYLAIDAKGRPSFIHESDLDSCYVNTDGSLVDRSQVPHHSVEDIIKARFRPSLPDGAKLMRM